MLKAAAVVAMLFLVSCERHPSDQEMIDFFREHRSEFIELRDIAAADYSPDMTRIEREDLDIDWENNPPEILISSDLSSMAEGRKQSYRILMDQLKVKQLQMWPRGVEFLVSSRGLAVSGSAKMYVWTDEPPFGPVVERVEDPLPKEGFVTENWFNGYRIIEEEWYLHYSAV